ncbi:MAG TPA: hypothetical protein VM368_01205, partial [Flavisolibacter sp.]|nr:hypothetical protein [Flavisolibacter sp.]
FYSLNIKDIQTVAKKEVKRSLTPAEIETIKKIVSDSINWYEIIANALRGNIKTETKIKSVQ